MARALVIADDLTGAMDSGHEFAARGFETVLVLEGRDELEDPARDVRVVDTDSRSVSAGTAARTVEAVIDAHPTEVVYKKIDSTLRGNLVPEIDAAIAASGADLALVAPAFPATGRTTTAGTHLVGGVPVAEVHDGKEGPTTSHLRTLLAESAYPVVECSIGAVNRGPEAVRELLSSVDRPAIVACDASEEGHLDTIARAAAEAGDVLYVGSAGLARYVRLPECGSASSEPIGSPAIGGEPTDDGSGTPERAEIGSVLGIAGSANPRTIEGVAALPTEWVVDLDVARAVVDPEDAMAAASGRAIERLSEKKPAVVTSVPGSGAIERARATGRAVDLDVGERIERALAAVAEAVWAEDPPEGLFLTGGAVAERVLDTLDATGISLTGRAVERGVPVGSVVGGRAEGTVVVTKAGGFGTRETIANCLAHLGGENDRP